MKKIFFLLFIFTFTQNGSFSQKVISITNYGIKPDSRQNVMPALHQALSDCKKTNGSAILSFPKGRYDFYPIKDENGKVGFPITEQKNLTIDGGGSEFIFHYDMNIALIDASADICMKNFSVDWDRPFTSQAVIADVTDTYIDLCIDRTSYPFVIENDTLKFEGEGWKKPVMHVYNNLYDAQKHEIVYNTWDDPLGTIFQNKAKELLNGNVRIHCTPKIKPEKGTIVVLYHFRYYKNCFTATKCKNLSLSDITIYHGLSHGIVGTKCENVSLNNFSMRANEKKGRVFSIIADATHFTNCKGTILVENCKHTGQGDDFINVHGRNVCINKIIDPKTVLVAANGYVMEPSDTVWFLNKHDVQRGDTRVISHRKDARLEDGKTGFLLTFSEPLPDGIQEGDIIENKTWNASLILRNCEILKKHRARGILVTTPKSVIIENNYFHTAGTAILIEGDNDFWFESGANTNVQIRNNIFDNCLSSGCKTGDRWEWGEAVITITPSHRPESVKTIPYHQNIQIHDNEFRVFDAPLVHARSVDNLGFCHNSIIKTEIYKPYTWQKDAFLFEGCRKVNIDDNLFDSKYTTRTIQIQQMKKTDLHIKKSQKLTIKQ